MSFIASEKFIFFSNFMIHQAWHSIHLLETLFPSIICTNHLWTHQTCIFIAFKVFENYSIQQLINRKTNPSTMNNHDIKFISTFYWPTAWCEFIWIAEERFLPKLVDLCPRCNTRAHVRQIVSIRTNFWCKQWLCVNSLWPRHFKCIFRFCCDIFRSTLVWIKME